MSKHSELKPLTSRRKDKGRACSPRSTDIRNLLHVDRSSDDDELEEKENDPSQRGWVDSRTPAPPTHRMTMEEQQLQEGFSKVKFLLKDVERLKFSASVSGLDSKGKFSCIFWVTGKFQLSWECGTSLSDLHKLVDKLQRDPRVRGLEHSIPPLPEKRKNSQNRQSVNDPLTNLAQRDMLAEFVRQMFTSLSFLSHAVVLSTFKVPSIVRAKIDSLMKLCQTPILSSWLHKDVRHVKGWKKRWAVLYPDLTLRYYDKDGDSGAGKGFKGMIDIQALYHISHRSDGDHHSFDIMLKHCWEERLHPRSYKFWTSDASLKLAWVNAVQKLADGDVLKHTPKFSEIYEPASSLTSTNAWPLESLSSRLELEKANHFKMLSTLAELRVELDSFKATRSSELRELERIEDEWSNLHGELQRTNNAVQKGRNVVQNLKRQFGLRTQQWEERFEEVERQIQTERKKYQLRSPFFLDPQLDCENHLGRRCRRKTLVVNKAPSAHAGQLDVIAGDNESRSCDVWFLKIRNLPYIEWPTVDDGRRGFRINISGQIKEGADQKSFTLSGPSKSCKNVTFRAKSAEECQKWVQAIKSIQSNSTNDFSEEKTIDKFNEKAVLQLNASTQEVGYENAKVGSRMVKTSCSPNDFKEGSPVHRKKGSPVHKRIQDSVSERLKKLQSLRIDREMNV